MTVFVVEQIEDHATGWVLGVFSSRQLADEWCAATAQDSFEIGEFEVDGQVEALFSALTQNPGEDHR